MANENRSPTPDDLARRARGHRLALERPAEPARRRRPARPVRPSRRLEVGAAGRPRRRRPPRPAPSMARTKERGPSPGPGSSRRTTRLLFLARVHLGVGFRQRQLLGGIREEVLESRLLDLRDLFPLENDVAVVLHAGAGRDQPADDDVLLQAAQTVHLAARSRPR